MRCWYVEKDEHGSWVAAWDGDWLPNTYDSKEEALIAILDQLSNEVE